MIVTDVKVRKIFLQGKMKGIFSVTIDDAFVIHDVKVVEGKKGIFVAMPSKRNDLGEFHDIAHPISQESRDMIQNIVLTTYYQALESQKDQKQVQDDINDRDSTAHLVVEEDIDKNSSQETEEDGEEKLEEDTEEELFRYGA